MRRVRLDESELWGEIIKPPGDCGAFKVGEPLRCTFLHLLFLSLGQKRSLLHQGRKGFTSHLLLILSNRMDTEQREAKGPVRGWQPSLHPPTKALTTCPPSLSVSTWGFQSQLLHSYQQSVLEDDAYDCVTSYTRLKPSRVWFVTNPWEGEKYKRESSSTQHKILSIVKS